MSRDVYVHSFRTYKLNVWYSTLLPCEERRSPQAEKEYRERISIAIGNKNLSLFKGRSFTCRDMPTGTRVFVQFDNMSYFRLYCRNHVTFEGTALLFLDEGSYEELLVPHRVVVFGLPYAQRLSKSVDILVKLVPELKLRVRWELHTLSCKKGAPRVRHLNLRHTTVAKHLLDLRMVDSDEHVISFLPCGWKFTSVMENTCMYLCSASEFNYKHLGMELMNSLQGLCSWRLINYSCRTYVHVLMLNTYQANTAPPSLHAENVSLTLLGRPSTATLLLADYSVIFPQHDFLGYIAGYIHGSVLPEHLQHRIEDHDVVSESEDMFFIVSDSETEHEAKQEKEDHEDEQVERSSSTVMCKSCAGNCTGKLHAQVQALARELEELRSSLLYPNYNER
jgi:hypothetical protein